MRSIRISSGSVQAGSFTITSISLELSGPHGYFASAGIRGNTALGLTAPCLISPMEFCLSKEVEEEQSRASLRDAFF
jgi:hypothetical protein